MRGGQVVSYNNWLQMFVRYIGQNRKYWWENINLIRIQVICHLKTHEDILHKLISHLFTSVLIFMINR